MIIARHGGYGNVPASLLPKNIKTLLRIYVWNLYFPLTEIYEEGAFFDSLYRHKSF